MKKLWLLLFVLLPVLGVGQVITTVAGTGSGINTGDGGLATAAGVYFPVYGVFDKFGNYYFTNSAGNTVRKIVPTGLITTVAGTGTSGYNGDGIPATTSQLKSPQAVAVDTLGNIYISDRNDRIRKVDISTGIISTIVGTGIAGYSGDGGLATAAQIYGPIGLFCDKLNNLYIADYGNNVVRKVNSSGTISTVAGNGIVGSPYNNNAPATSVGLTAWDVCVDIYGNFYLTDSKRVCKINSSGIITTIAGTGISGYSGDGGPATAAMIDPFYIRVDKFNNVIISGYQGNFIRLVNSSGFINTIAGTGFAGYTGDGGFATAAKLNYPGGLALDTCDNIYIPDSRNNRIRKITYPHCNYLDVPLFHAKTEISIYPNPASTHLTISAAGKIKEVRVYDMLGQIRERSTGSGEREERIDVSHLPEGGYFVRVVDEDGGVVVRRFVKED